MKLEVPKGCAEDMHLAEVITFSELPVNVVDSPCFTNELSKVALIHFLFRMVDNLQDFMNSKLRTIPNPVW